MAFYWDAMDAWYEEDERVHGHPHDPYSRIDVLSGSRHVKVSVDGTVLAESDRPMVLFETGLPVRYYLPREEVRLDLLVCFYGERVDLEVDGRAREPRRG